MRLATVYGRADCPPCLSGGIEGAQDCKTAGTGNGGQVAWLTVDKALCQPGKRRALHPVGGDPQLGRVGDAPAGQQAGQLRQQWGVMGAAAADIQLGPALRIIQCGQLAGYAVAGERLQGALHIRRGMGVAGQFAIEPVEGEHLPPRALGVGAAK